MKTSFRKIYLRTQGEQEIQIKSCYCSLLDCAMSLPLAENRNSPFEIAQELTIRKFFKAQKAANTNIIGKNSISQTKKMSCKYKNRHIVQTSPRNLKIKNTQLSSQQKQRIPTQKYKDILTLNKIDTMPSQNSLPASIRKTDIKEYSNLFSHSKIKSVTTRQPNFDQTHHTINQLGFSPIKKVFKRLNQWQKVQMTPKEVSQNYEGTKIHFRVKSVNLSNVIDDSPSKNSNMQSDKTSPPNSPFNKKTIFAKTIQSVFDQDESQHMKQSIVMRNSPKKMIRKLVQRS